MAGLIPRSLIDEFQNTVDEFNVSYEKGGLGKKIELIFEIGLQLVPDTIVESQIPSTHSNIGLAYGGRGQAASITNGAGLVDNAGSGGLIPQEQTRSKVIYGRIYPVLKPHLKLSIGAASTQTIWQINASKDYLADFKRCKEAILDVDFKGTQVKVRLFKPPAQYGLGEAHQCISFWEQIG